MRPHRAVDKGQRKAREGDQVTEEIAEKIGQYLVLAVFIACLFWKCVP